MEITGRLDRELIQALPSSVKYIASHASGYEIIDVPACTERSMSAFSVVDSIYLLIKYLDIAVANTPRVVDAATADMVLFLILGALRRAWIPQSSLRAGVWTKGVPFGHDPKDKVLGILGLGGVGIATAQRAVPFGFKLQYHNRRPVEGLEKLFTAENVPKFVSLDELLTTSDIVSLHLPLNESTRHCISTEQIAKMKDGVIIINTARGGVLDEKALIAALDSGKVWSAGLDVFEGEPEVLPELRSHPSVMMLPHLGTVTIETQVRGNENVASISFIY